MNSRSMAFLTAFCVMGCTVSYSADMVPLQLTDEGIKDTFTEVQNSVRAEWNVSGALDISEDGSIVSRPDGHIEVGRAALREALGSVESRYRLLALRFIFLHEIWHQVQFREQGSDIENDAYLGRFLGCQADIMTTRYLGQPFVDAFLADPDAIEKFYGGLFDLGDFEEGGSSHPSIEHRKLAVVRGLMRLLFESKVPINGGETSNLAFAILGGMRNGEDATQWSFRQCQMITQMDQSAIAVVARGKPQLKWNTDTNGNVTFRIPYSNSGSRSVRVEMEIVMGQVPRKAPHNARRRRLLFGRDYVFELAPGGTYVVSGQLPWVADDVMMPEIIFPPDTGSLIRSVFLGEESDPSDGSGKVMELSADEVALKDALLALSSGAKSEFLAYRQGSGAYFAGDIQYRSTMQLPGAISTEIVLGRTGESDVRASFAEKDEDSVRKLYASYDTALRKMFPRKLIKKSSRGKYSTLKLQLSRNSE